MAGTETIRRFGLNMLIETIVGLWLISSSWVSGVIKGLMGLVTQCRSMVGYIWTTVVAKGKGSNLEIEESQEQH